MNKKYCKICGEMINDGERIISDNGIKMCLKCYNAFQLDADSDAVYNDEECSSEYTDNLNKKSAGGNIWVKYLKKICYLLWGVITVIGALTGYGLWEFVGDGINIKGILIGGKIGFIAGFASIAVTMAFIALCENISVMNQRIDKILIILQNKY